MAPELGEAGALDRDGASADIFAVAVLLAEVLTGDEPFADARNDVAIALRVRDGERPALPKSTPARLREALMRCWDSNSAARPDAKDLLLDLLDLRLDNDASTVPDDGVEVVRVTTTTGCKQLSSVLAEQGLRDVIPIVRENEVDIEAARLMDNDDWQEIGLDERAARSVVASLGTDSIRLKVRTPDGEVVELTVTTSETVETLLQRLESEYGCDVERPWLFRKSAYSGSSFGTALLDNQSLFDQRIRTDVELELRRRRTPPLGVPFTLYVKTDTGRMLHLTAESCFTLKALIQLALESMDPPRPVEDDWRYRINFFGRYLYACETTLERVDVGKEDTLWLVRRMLGGS